MLSKLLSILFPPTPVKEKLDSTSWNYFQRLDRLNLPYRTQGEYVGRVVPGSVKQGQSIERPASGTKESRALAWAR